MRWAPVLLLALCAASARADDAKRALPDYDGRGAPPTTVGEVLIWVPRVAAAPLYVVSEYVVRRPAELLVVTAERGRWPQRLIDYLDGPIGVVPTGLVDLGLRPTLGVYFFWNDALAAGNQVRATASFSAGVATATLVDRFAVGGGWQLAVRGALSRRDDASFYGLGPGTRFDDVARYEERRVEGGVAASLRLRGLSRLRLEAGVRSVDFGSGTCCGDPSIGDAAAAGLFPLPPGFAEGGQSGPFAAVRLVLDSRARAPGSGVALALDGEQGSDPATDRAWLRAGVTLSGSVELPARRRVASLVLHAAVAEPLAGDEVPFTDLATLGGSGPLPGFGAGRLRGRSAVAATVLYEWPVWAYLTGVAHAAAGEVFGEGFEGLELGRLRGSTGLGVRSAGLGDHRFELLVALGTRPFDDGGEIDSVRLVVGGVIGF